MEYKYTKTFSHNGKRYYIRGQTLKEVYSKMEQKKMQLEQDPQTLRPEMTLMSWTEQCIETYKVNQSEVTRKKFLARVRHCILEPIGDMRLIDIKPMHLQNVLNTQQGNSRTQVNEVYQALKFIFRYALHNGLIAKDPTEGLQKPVGYKHHRRALTSVERKYFIKVGMTDRRYYFYLLMIFCGCRPSEAAECKGYDLSVKDGTAMLHIRGTKTDNADRYVPVPMEFWDLIKDTPPDDYIAQTSTGAPINENKRRYLWNSYTRQINLAMGCRTYRNALIPPYPLADDLVPYCLRHEYCTDLARKGIDIRVAQKLMGHSDIKLTANIYTNLETDDIKDAGDILGAKVATPSATPSATSKQGKRGKN